MKNSITIGLIGDYDKAILAHRAIPIAIVHAADFLRISTAIDWIPTDEIRNKSRVAHFDGLWCVPGSPYRSMDGALLAIRHAREASVPFLGTCGGFQSAVVEYAQNVLGWSDADHAESSPNARRAVISLLECALVEASGVVHFVPGSRIATAYGAIQSTEGYHCRYGLNPEFREAILSGPLRVTARDDSGDIRAIELDGHPFFVATLFQPERAALVNKATPLVQAFLSTCAT